MATREDYLDYIDQYYGFAYTYYGLAKDDIWLAFQKYHIWSDHNVLGALIDGCMHLYTAVGALCMKSEPIGGRARIPHFLRFYTIDEAPDFDLTMDDLINAMLLADPYQVEYFVGLVDAYRQSIWNRPFNQEFFAALARGFEQWE